MFKTEKKKKPIFDIKRVIKVFTVLLPVISCNRLFFYSFTCALRLLPIILLFAVTSRLYAQKKDSVIYLHHNISLNSKVVATDLQQGPVFRHTTRALIVPVSLITYGVISQLDEDLKEMDISIKKIVRRDSDFNTPIDNYLQYAPGLAVFGLNAAGIKSRNNFLDRTMIYLLSNAIMGITVQSIKKISRVQRPDGFGTNAFPSGHTATAFVGAEFLYQEYKYISPWYGIAGYAAATTTGILRMYNNKHWFRDVVAGAGFGVASVKIAYWIYPAIKRDLFKYNPMKTMIMPYFQNKDAGLALTYNLGH